MNNTTFSRVTLPAVLQMYLKQLIFVSKTAIRYELEAGSADGWAGRPTHIAKSTAIDASY